ncbi:DUF559 domain-containing protein [Kineococcus rubinsiae]|uniref:DUF559 domain-containing protein n=1 Tax=Kineococcus rubinsiae TaxID=2609562 RepID=UPI0014314CE3|nr:DUF559 domain-containing protein [Kineococcus rubinsiae]NIZ90498.1 DUF559 domain-containing protein [Kineococcus rubinsiae]
MDPVLALTVRGGSARWSDLGRDVARGTLLRAVRDGRVERPGRGVFALPGADPGQLAALRVGGVLSCHSAAAARGWALLRPPAAVHLEVAAGSRRTLRGAVLHRSGSALSAGGATDLRGTVVGAVRCLPLVEAVVLLDGLLRDGVLDPDDLDLVAAGLPRRFPHRRAFALVDARAESVLESAVRVACVLAGLRVASQVRLAGVGRTDLLVEGWLVVETDGREHHAATFQEDRRRDARTAQLGGLTLRFTHADVVHRLEETVQLITEVARAGPRGRLRPVPPG